MRVHMAALISGLSCARAMQIAREQLKRLQDNLDMFGQEYKGDDKPQQVCMYACTCARMHVAAEIPQVTSRDEASI